MSLDSKCMRTLPPDFRSHAPHPPAYAMWIPFMGLFCEM